MEFANRQLSQDDLPKFSEVSLTALHERFVWLRLAVMAAVYLIIILAMVIPLIVVVQLVPEAIDALVEFAALVFAIVLAILLLMGVTAWFVVASTNAVHYAIREHDLVLNSGVFWKKEVIQPMKRVQHVEVTQGPLDKRYGLANLKLFSAGTSRSTFRIPGIEHALAEDLRQYVLDYQKKSN